MPIITTLLLAILVSTTATFHSEALEPEQWMKEAVTQYSDEDLLTFRKILLNCSTPGSPKGQMARYVQSKGKDILPFLATVAWDESTHELTRASALSAIAALSDPDVCDPPDKRSVDILLKTARDRVETLKKTHEMDSSENTRLIVTNNASFLSSAMVALSRCHDDRALDMLERIASDSFWSGDEVPVTEMDGRSFDNQMLIQKNALSHIANSGSERAVIMFATGKCPKSIRTGVEYPIILDQLLNTAAFRNGSADSTTPRDSEEWRRYEDLGVKIIKELLPQRAMNGVKDNPTDVIYVPEILKVGQERINQTQGK